MLQTITSLQERDACLALAFLLLLFWLFLQLSLFAYLAMFVLLLGMIWPGAMRPFAWAWFGLARILGSVVSPLLLTIVWLLLVVPVGFIRRAMGRDPLGLKNWQSGKPTFFASREHQYGAADLKNPY